MQKTIAILPGDGIGPEVMDEALRVLDKIAEKFGHEFTYKKGLVGGAAYDEYEVHFPDATKEICESSDAILFGSVGGPVQELHKDKWRTCEVDSLLTIRKTFNFNANFRPAKVYKELKDLCPLKKELIENGVDILVIRELVGDLYFGEHKFYTENEQRIATDQAIYTEEQVTNIAHTGFQAAMRRKKKLISIDKANVLHTSKLWREIVEEVAKEYPEVEYEHMLVDNAAMQIVKRPDYFDVMLAPNMFGDILSDLCAVLPGSLGLMPSASLNKDGFGMYEPAGGSAPDIAGQGIANPIAQIQSAAMMLRFSFDLNDEADAINNAIDQVIADGFRTGDIYTEGMKKVGTKEVTDEIIDRL